VGGYELLNVTQILKNYWSIISHKSALTYLLCSSFVAGALFSFLTEISFIYIEFYHLSEKKFAWLFALNIISMMIFNRINHYLLDLWSPRRILKIGLFIQIVSAFLLLLLALLQINEIILVVILLMLIIGSFGIIGPNNMACYMTYFPRSSGTATAVLGSSQFAMGALVSLILSHLHDGTQLPMYSMIFISTLLGLISFYRKS